jgi:general secretion pathway protein N
MKRVWPLLALGLGAFSLFALFTLPASVVLSRLTSSGVTVGGVSGTIWKGEAQVLQVNGVHIGGIAWKLRLLPLLTLRASADIKVTRTDGFAQTTLTTGRGGRLEFEDLTASLPLSSLPPGVVQGGWGGMMNLKLAQLTLDQGWPVSASGTAEILDVTGPAANPVNRGSYKATFPAEGAPENTLMGALTDIGGPLQVNGTLQLKNDRSYLLQAMVATKPDAPKDLVDALQFLGEPDAQGRRPFAIDGTM